MPSNKEWLRSLSDKQLADEINEIRYGGRSRSQHNANAWKQLELDEALAEQERRQRERVRAAYLKEGGGDE